MSPELIFLPLLLQIFLVLWLYLLLARRKAAALAAGTVDLNRRALHDDAWPETVRQVNNNIRNQFELPVLFYVLTLMLWQLRAVDALALGVSVLFVLSRIGHALVHVRANVVAERRRLFMLGAVLILILALRVLQVLLVAVWR